MWGGGQGYRDSGLQNAGWYIRARHYSSESSQWTSCDPLYYRPGIFAAIPLGQGLSASAPSVYVSGRPTLRLDASGLYCDLTSTVPIYSPSKPQFPQNTYVYLSGECDTTATPYCGKTPGLLGLTSCNFTTKSPFTMLCDDSCACDCTFVHELTHQADISACCAYISKGWLTLDTIINAGNQTIYQDFGTFQKLIEPWTECHAYTAEQNCLLELAAATTDPSCLNLVITRILDSVSCKTYYCDTLGGSTQLTFSPSNPCKLGTGKTTGGGSDTM